MEESFHDSSWQVTITEMAELLRRLHLMFSLSSEVIAQMAAYPFLRFWTQSVREQLHATRDLQFQTSGSTGHPKFQQHTWAALGQEVDFLTTLFPATKRIVRAVPCHHIYGFLFTLLLPQRLAVPTVEARTWSPSKLQQALQPGDLLVSHPLHWQSFQRSVMTVPAGVTGVTSTAPFSSATWQQLQQQGLQQIVEVYGSTETAGVAWREQPEDWFTLFPYWNWDPSANVPTLRRAEEAAAFPLMDQIELHPQDHRRFRPLRRRDEAVQVAGHNVFPSHIADRLREHSLVEDCAVRLMRPDEGSRLKAFVVGTGNRVLEPAEQQSLRAWIASQLPAPQQPKSLRFGSELPRNDAGKLTDWT
jgi:4-coumarate--CoA ligase